MACCGIGEGCGRRDVDEPGPGLEQWNGKYSCTLCYVNKTRFAQPNFKKKHKAVQQAEPEQLARPAETKRDIFGEIDDD